MNVITAESLLLDMALYVAVAIGIAGAATYFLRPKLRERYPGGKTRYLTAVIIQAAGFMIPIPIVLFLLIGAGLHPLAEVLLAGAAGGLVVVGLRFLPITGPLLRDLAKVRLELALERASGRPQ